MDRICLLTGFWQLLKRSYPEAAVAAQSAAPAARSKCMEGLEALAQEVVQHVQPGPVQGLTVGQVAWVVVVAVLLLKSLMVEAADLAVVVAVPM